MRHSILRSGSSGPLVRDLQLALNARLNPSPNLMISGIFDARTTAAVRAFQNANWLEVDGIAGPCTLDSIYETELSRPILHNVRFLPQPTEMTCWAAAVAMLKGTTVDAVRMVTPRELVAPNGGLHNGTGTGTVADIHRAFARAHGLQYHGPQSWPVSTLIGMLRRGPLVMEMVRNPADFQAGKAVPGHYFVVVGARGSHLPDGTATTLRFYDPYPPGRGEILSMAYASLLRHVPLASFGILAV